MVRRWALGRENSQCEGDKADKRAPEHPPPGWPELEGKEAEDISLLPTPHPHHRRDASLPGRPGQPASFQGPSTRRIYWAL